MISENLFDLILVKPVEELNADKLCIVSGFATSAMTSKHFKRLEELQKRQIQASVNIDLIVGMCCELGIDSANHRGFQKLADTDFAGKFTCSYIDKAPPVHSKVYVWLKENIPVKAFIGSADYSQASFFREQREIMIESDPVECFSYYQSLINETFYCTNLEADNFIKTSADQNYLSIVDESTIDINGENQTEAEDDLHLKEVYISFLNRKGDLPAKSGLNWGQDGKGNKRQTRRTGNEAYIRVPSAVYNTDFFPGIAEHFTIITDDDKSLLCTREQSRGKSITTPKSNSQLGEYFRHRLGIGSGELVLKSHLENYGRTDVRFYKLDEESYLMDFSV